MVYDKRFVDNPGKPSTVPDYLFRIFEVYHEREKGHLETIDSEKIIGGRATGMTYSGRKNKK